jgi:hypothetical protein
MLSLSLSDAAVATASRRASRPLRSPGPALRAPPRATQLQRIDTLVAIDQYNSARLELREGPAAGLRRDLREAELDFGESVDDEARCPLLCKAACSERQIRPAVSYCMLGVCSSPG